MDLITGAAEVHRLSLWFPPPLRAKATRVATLFMLKSGA